MRADPAARAALERVMSLCDSATPGMYRQVAHVDLRRPDLTNVKQMKGISCGVRDVARARLRLLPELPPSPLAGAGLIRRL